MSTPLDRVLGPVARLLDPREREEAAAQPILDSVNIPFSEMPNRTHELPPRNATIEVAATGPMAEAAAEWLRAHGRNPALESDFELGWTEGGRLWRPNEFLVECLAGGEPGRAIDLGCGTGRDAVAMAAWGHRVVAVDHLPDAVELGKDLALRYLPKEAFPIDWRIADLVSNRPSLGGGYDFATAFFFYHPRLIEQAIGLLRPGGSILLEAFTPVHRGAKGKPGPARVADPDDVRRLVSPLAVRFLDAAWHGDRHTVRLWADTRA